MGPAWDAEDEDMAPKAEEESGAAERRAEWGKGRVRRAKRPANITLAALREGCLWMRRRIRQCCLAEMRSGISYQGVEYIWLGIMVKNREEEVL